MSHKNVIASEAKQSIYANYRRGVPSGAPALPLVIASEAKQSIYANYRRGVPSGAPANEMNSL